MAAQLEGRIEYRLSLPLSNELKQQRLNSHGAPRAEKKAEGGQSRQAGFYLIVTPQKEEYLLSVPQSLLKVVCDAVRFRENVRVSRYTTIPLVFPISGSGKRKHSDLTRNTANPSVFLEIQDNGLHLDFSHRPNNNDTESFSSLEQLHQEELRTNESEQHCKNDDKDCKRKKTSNRYNVRGMVDSISPIIAIDEPFALMEIYDNDSEKPYSAVVVFQGAASLCCHHGVLPGECISLRNVKRQRWKVPEEMKRHNLPHLVNRIPSHVFVLKDPTSLVWHVPSRPNVLPSLPSTPIPLVSLQGQIVSREWASRGASTDDLQDRSSYMIHSIDVELLPSTETTKATSTQLSRQRHTLLLTYYPMITSLTLSLRRGAVIQAVNIHCIGSAVGDCRTFFYGLCVRSTLSILKMPPPLQKNDSPTVDKEVSLVDQGGLYHPSRPLAFLSVQRSYLEYAGRQQLHRWYRQESNLAKSRKGTGQPSFEDIARVWWYEYSGSGNSPAPAFATRNPYVEFFDHAHDGGGDSNRKTGGCHCSLFPTEVSHLLPSWVALNKLWDHGVRVMQERLAKTIRLMGQGNERLQVGWTGTIHLHHSDLLKAMHAQDKDVDDNTIQYHGLCTGGVIIHSSADDETGFSHACGQHPQLASALLANDHCVLPGTRVAKVLQDSSCLEKVTVEGRPPPTFAIGFVEGIVASCICIGLSSGTHQMTPPGENMHPLPLHDSSALVSEDHPSLSNLKYPRGACAVFNCHGSVFVISVQLKCKSLVPVFTARDTSTHMNGDSFSQPTKLTSNGSRRPHEGGAEPQWFTVQDCLDPKASVCFRGNEKDAACVVGLLTRQRFSFQLSRIGGNWCRGLVLTLSHIPAGRLLLAGNLSTLQTLEIKTGTTNSNAVGKRSLLKALIIKVLPTPEFSVDDAVKLALAFWEVADNASVCAITSGGWDDAFPHSTGSHSTMTKSTTGIVVRLRGTIFHEQDHRGYERFTCPLAAICAGFIRVTTPQPSKGRWLDAKGSEAVPSTVLDFMGGFKFLPGSLDRLPLRRLKMREFPFQDSFMGMWRLSNQKAELMTLASQDWTGIPDCSLADMFHDVCCELKNQQPNSNICNEEMSKGSAIAPSFVRKLSGARFLGILFCQAQVICRKCFQPLSQRNSKSICVQPKSRHIHDAKQDWRNDQEQHRPTFWHLPLPIFFSEKNEAPNADTKRNESQFLDSANRFNLRCPNSCSERPNAEIKWECSGIVDDGTGQAKLHAEREAAMLLLGMDQSMVDVIVKGAFQSQSCSIVFSRTLPPPSNLAKAVEAANANWAAQKNERKQYWARIESSTGSPTDGQKLLGMLGPVDQAVYLMYQHCRESKASTRRLDYLVRCKPLSDRVFHLNHTEVDVIAPGLREGCPSSQKVATYSLPPLKLNLVDCLQAASSADVIDETWDLIRSMKEGE